MSKKKKPVVRGKSCDGFDYEGNPFNKNTPEKPKASSYGYNPDTNYPKCFPHFGEKEYQCGGLTKMCVFAEECAHAKALDDFEEQKPDCFGINREDECKYDDDAKAERSCIYFEDCMSKYESYEDAPSCFGEYIGCPNCCDNCEWSDECN